MTIIINGNDIKEFVNGKSDDVLGRMLFPGFFDDNEYSLMSEGLLMYGVDEDKRNALSDEEYYRLMSECVKEAIIDCREELASYVDALMTSASRKAVDRING